MKKLTIQIFTTILIITSLAFTVNCQAYQIDSMIVKITLAHDGTASITENIYVEFDEERRGIIRSIPYLYNLDGQRYTLKIDNITVAGENISISKLEGNTNIRIGNKNKYITGKKHYLIKYTVKSPFIKGEDYEEFYWNITGNDWDTNIGKANFEITLPKDIPIRYNDIRYFTGVEGSIDNNANVVSDDNTIKGTSTGVLQAGQGMTLAVKLPEGFITDPTIFKSSNSQSDRAFSWSWWTLLPASLFFAIWGWWKGLRSTKEDQAIVPISYPPNDLSPAEVGGFIDGIVHDRDVLSLLPFWGNLGFLKIRKTKDDMFFEKIKDISNTRSKYEITFFNSIFESKDIISQSEISTNMYRTIADIKTAIQDGFKNEELYDKRYDFWFRAWRIIVIGIVCVLSGIALILVGKVVVGIALFICGILCFVLRGFRGVPSDKGRSLILKLQGLEAHLKSDDHRVIKEMIDKDPIYYERLYPYAFALGLAKTWTTKVEKHSSKIPYWYYGDNVTTSISSFSEAITPKAISSAFIKYPVSSSSTSGGGFSGGSSGGGFGGGGGKSW